MPLDQAPETTAKPVVDKQALLAKYRAERDKRLRPDGNAQYLRLDRPVRPLPRRSLHAGHRSASRKTDHVTFAFVGGGFAGPGHRRAAGRGGRSPTCASSRRAATSAAPGTGTAIPARSATPPRWSTCRCSKRPATCRPRSTPTRRRSSSSASASASSTASTTTRCSTPRSPTSRGTTTRSLWVISTNRGDAFTAQFIGLGTGPLHVPKLPGIPGIETLQGPLVPHQPLGLRLHRRRSGSRRRAARQAGRQARGDHRHRRDRRAVPCRTSPAPARRSTSSSARPSSVDVRGNVPIDPRLVRLHRRRRAGRQRWLENFTANQAGGCGRRGPGPGRLDRPVAPHPREAHGAAARRARRRRTCWRRSRTPTSRRWRRSAPASTPSSRDRDDGREAEGLVPPALQAAVLPRRVPAGVQRARARTWSTPTARASSGSPRTASWSAAASTRSTASSTPRASRSAPSTSAAPASTLSAATALKLSEAWADGMRSKHGIHVHGFPNAFFVQPTQGANLISNVPHNLTEAGQTIAADRRATRRTAAPRRSR